MTDDEHVIGTHEGNDGNTYRVRLILDECGMINPRKNYDHVCHVVMVPNSNYLAPDSDGGPLSDAWRHLWERSRRQSDGVVLFQRYVSMFHGGRTLYDSPYDGPSCVWYILPDAPIGQPGDPNAMDEALGIERDEYRAWAEGDIWGRTIEVEVEYHRKDHATGDSFCHWEEVDDETVWGYLGREWAEQAANEALTDYLRWRGLMEPAPGT